MWFQCENIFALHNDRTSSEKETSRQSDLRNGSICYKRYHLAIYSGRYRNPTAEIPSGFAWRQKRAVPICWISAKNAAVLAETCRGKHKRWDFVHTLRFQAHVKGSTPDRRLANDTWCRSCAKSTGNPEKELYRFERKRTAAGARCRDSSCNRRKMTRMVAEVSWSASSRASFPYRATFGRGSGDIVTQFSPLRSAVWGCGRARKFPGGKRRETTNRSNARRCSITFRASVLTVPFFFFFFILLWRSSRGTSPLRRLILSPESPLVLRSSLPVIQFRRVFQVRQGETAKVR